MKFTTCSLDKPATGAMETTVVRGVALRTVNVTSAEGTHSTPRKWKNRGGKASTTNREVETYPQRTVHNVEQVCDNFDMFCVNNQNDVKEGTKDSINIDVEINDKKLELDTGSAVFLISIKNLKKLRLKTNMRSPRKKLLKTYTLVPCAGLEFDPKPGPQLAVRVQSQPRPAVIFQARPGPGPQTRI